MSAAIIIAGLIGLSIFVTFAGLAQILSASGEAIDDRLGRYATREGQNYAFIDANQTESGDDNASWIESQIARRAEASGILGELAKADLKVTATEWTMITFGVIVAMFFVGLLLFQTPILAMVTAVVGFFLPRFYLRWRQGSRIKTFNKQLPDAIVLLSNSLRAGYSFLQSMEVLSREMPPPISSEFGRAVREVSLGLTTEQALQNLYNRLPSEDLDMMITAVNIQAEVGGNLAEILDVLAHTIRERNRIFGQIKSMTAQQMLTGNILSLLPVILAALLFYINPEYMSVLYTTTCGWIMLAVAGFMVMLGYFAIRKIVQIEV